MKKQQPARLWLPTALALALFVLAAVWMVRSVHVTAGRSDQESLRLAEQALRRAAVSCYALEGAYPASYDDLKQRSGLAIDEELVRLTSHVAQLRALLCDPAPAGRRLDFLAQEFNREVNTIASKSQDIAITRLAMDGKAEIEKLREQVQNVE